MKMLVKRGTFKKLKEGKTKVRNKLQSLKNREKKNLGIDGSTFRAYRKFKIGPSVVYRDWAMLMMEDLVPFKAIKSRDDFLELHIRLQKSLDKFWYNKQKKRLSVAQRNKIIDLFVKYVGASNHIKPLIKYGNVPLDKFSLLFLKKLTYGVVISDKPAMGDIKNLETYNVLQEIIWYATSNAKIPNLYFDYYAWNLKKKYNR